MRLYPCCLLLALLALPFPARAACSFTSGGMRIANIPLPATIDVARDAPVGTELWNSGWVTTSIGADVRCTGSGFGSGKHAAGIGAAVPGFTNRQGRPNVYATSVPGIGISVYFSETGSAYSDPYNGTPLTARSLETVMPAQYYWNNGFGWFVRLVKTGPVSGSEALQVAGFSEAGVHGLVLSRLYIGGATTVVARACEVDVGSRNIAVSLPPAEHADFAGGVGALADDGKARTFTIGLRCDAGVAVSYRIDGTGAAGMPHVLGNGVGPGMASGVGVQLFQGDTGSTTVQPLGVTLPHAVTTPDEGTVGIELTAKYYRTAPQASDVTPGAVSASATFTLTYQ